MIPLYTIIIIAAIVIQAFFAASETAFTSVNRIKLKELVDSGDKHARKLDHFLEDEGFFLGTTLVGTNIAVVVSAVLATRIFAEYFGVKIAPVLTTALMVPLTLIFAEIVPKMIARQFSTSLALNIVTPLNRFARILHPLIVTVNFIAKVLLIPFGGRKVSGDMEFTKSDLKKILLLGHETGEVEADEVELIHKVLDLSAKRIEKIMVPLYRVSSISADDVTDNLKRLVSRTGFARIPV